MELTLVTIQTFGLTGSGTLATCKQNDHFQSCSGLTWGFSGHKRQLKIYFRYQLRKTFFDINHFRSQNARGHEPQSCLMGRQNILAFRQFLVCRVPFSLHTFHNGDGQADPPDHITVS